MGMGMKMRMDESEDENESGDELESEDEDNDAGECDNDPEDARGEVTNRVDGGVVVVLVVVVVFSFVGEMARHEGERGESGDGFGDVTAGKGEADGSDSDNAAGGGDILFSDFLPPSFWASFFSAACQDSSGGVRGGSLWGEIFLGGGGSYRRDLTPSFAVPAGAVCFSTHRWRSWFPFGVRAK